MSAKGRLVCIVLMGSAVFAGLACQSHERAAPVQQVEAKPAAPTEKSIESSAAPRIVSQPVAPKPAGPSTNSRIAPSPKPSNRALDNDTVQDRHPSHWPKKLRAKYVMLDSAID